MTIEIKSLLEIVIVVLTLKLIVSRWQPPLQESLQAIISIALGTIIALAMNPTVEGLVSGIISSGIAFYGGDLISEFTTIKDDIADASISEKKENVKKNK